MSARAGNVDRRARELSQLGPIGWYDDHLTRSTRCGCTAAAPDHMCDVGWALFRVAQAERGDKKPRSNT